MTGMNRLSPLIVRRVGPMAAAMPLQEPCRNFDALPVQRWLDDLKLFTTGWAGGLVFFGTFLG